MSQENKSIVAKAQALLKEHGYDVKTGHLYEVFSKLAGEKSWNIASSKNTSFLEKVISKITKEDPARSMTTAQLIKSLKNSIYNLDIKKYIEEIEAGTYRDKFYLGNVIAENRDHLKNFFTEPNALFAGSMGSGKSVAAVFTLNTWMAANSDQTILFIVDPYKGANDYQALFEYDQVYPVLNSEVGIARVLDLMYDEILARRDKFNELKIESAWAYEKKTGFKLPRVVLMFEEFQSLQHILDYDAQYMTPLTPANKLHQIMRVGRSYGVWIMAATQKVSGGSVPPSLVANFVQKQVFRISRADSAYLLGNETANEITSSEKGKAATDYGFVQFPYINIDGQKKFLEHFMLPLSCSCFYLTDELITNYLKGESTKDIYEKSSLLNLITNLDQVEAPIALSILKERQGYKVKAVDNNCLILSKGDETEILKIKIGTLFAKDIVQCVEENEKHKASKMIVCFSKGEVSPELYKLAIDLKVKILDKADLLKEANELESK